MSSDPGLTFRASDPAARLARKSDGDHNEDSPEVKRPRTTPGTMPSGPASTTAGDAAKMDPSVVAPPTETILGPSVGVKRAGQDLDDEDRIKLPAVKSTVTGGYSSGAAGDSMALEDLCLLEDFENYRKDKIQQNPTLQEVVRKTTSEQVFLFGAFYL